MPVVGVLSRWLPWFAFQSRPLFFFYAIAISLALLGGGAYQLNIILAWAYVALRVVHSLIQATTNVVRWRFLVFSLASLVLLALTLHAAMMLLHAHPHG